MRLKRSPQRAEKCLNRPPRDTRSNRKTSLFSFFLFLKIYDKNLQHLEYFENWKGWNVLKKKRKRQFLKNLELSFVYNESMLFSLALEFRFFVSLADLPLLRLINIRNRIARINITPCERRGKKRKKERETFRKRLSAFLLRRFFRHVENLNPKRGTHG